MLKYTNFHLVGIEMVLVLYYAPISLLLMFSFGFEVGQKKRRL